MAALTGESRPTPRICDAVPEAQTADARNCVFMGTSVVNGSGRAVVFATGLSTEFGRIYRLTAEMPSEDSPLQREVTVMARRVAAVAIAAGLGLFAVRAAASGDQVGSFVFALGVMVALVPSVLEAAGTLKADVLVACTRSDEDNLVISLLAKKRFSVPRVIARVNDPASDELFHQAWGSTRWSRRRRRSWR
ncbi:MAG TPA: NAD-binding protein [Streptosporangiaceae bacterium]|nr:NAD-binding protein [Streptosporangiaceae bacterium]